MTHLKNSILNLLKEREMVEGTERLTIIVCDGIYKKNKTRVLCRVHELEAEGKIVIMSARGGRGMKTIYKRNPNQPGLPRKRRGVKP
jgi:hypothetical protein